MKLFVDTVQMLLVVALVYPAFYLWDINKVDHFCSDIESGITKQAFIQTAQEQSVKIIDPNYAADLGKWNVTAVTWSPFSKHSCVVSGYAGLVSNARIGEI